MTEAINSLTLLFPRKTRTTDSLYAVIFHCENKHLRLKTDCVSKYSVNFLIRFPHSIQIIYSDELQGQLKSYPVTPTIYKNKDLGKHT